MSLQVCFNQYDSGSRHDEKADKNVHESMIERNELRGKTKTYDDSDDIIYSAGLQSSFPSNSIFPDDCTFGAGTLFGDGCTVMLYPFVGPSNHHFYDFVFQFGQRCIFGKYSKVCRSLFSFNLCLILFKQFGEECHFLDECEFGMNAQFGYGCTFGKVSFEKGCQFGINM